MRENSPSYIRNVASKSKTSYSILDEMKRRKHYKRFDLHTLAMLRCALILRYTSPQSYRLLLEKFPFPSVSLLNKIQQGGIDSVKAITLGLPVRRTESADLLVGGPR